MLNCERSAKGWPISSDVSFDRYQKGVPEARPFYFNILRDKARIVAELLAHHSIPNV